jgi:hypothetical protein
MPFSIAAPVLLSRLLLRFFDLDRSNPVPFRRTRELDSRCSLRPLFPGPAARPGPISCSASISNVKIPLCSPALISEDRKQEATQNLIRETRVPGAAIPERIRKREYPLPNGDLGEDTIDEVSGCVCHTPPPTRGTEPPTFARKSDEPIMATRITIHTQESVGRDAALEVGADLALHEASDDRSRVFEEWLEVLTNDMMKKRILRLVACVGNRIVVARTGLVLKRLSNRHAGSRGERKHLIISRFGVRVPAGSPSLSSFS